MNLLSLRKDILKIRTKNVQEGFPKLSEISEDEKVNLQSLVGAVDNVNDNVAGYSQVDKPENCTILGLFLRGAELLLTDFEFYPLAYMVED